MTSIAVVLAVGARLNGQASFGTRTFSTTSLCRASDDFSRAGDRNDLHRKPLQRRQQIQQFLRFAGIAQRQNHVAVVDDPQVAVQRIHAVEHDAGRAGAGQRGGNFLADVARFADADDDDFAALAQGLDDHFDRAVEARRRVARALLSSAASSMSNTFRALAR